MSTYIHHIAQPTEAFDYTGFQAKRHPAPSGMERKKDAKNANQAQPEGDAFEGSYWADGRVIGDCFTCD